MRRGVGVRVDGGAGAGYPAAVVAGARAVGAQMEIAPVPGAGAVARDQAGGVLDPRCTRGEGVRGRGVRRVGEGGCEQDGQGWMLRHRHPHPLNSVFAPIAIRRERSAAAAARGRLRDGPHPERRGE